MSRIWKIIISIGLGFAGFSLIVYITAPFGPGVSADSVHYIAAADNLIRHSRFIGYDGLPFLSWPPLYPLLLATVSWIAKSDPFLVGGYLNASFFGIIIVLSGILFQRAFDNSLRWFFLGAWIGLSSFSFVILATSITSDPLFIILVLGYMLVGGKFMTNPKSSSLLGLGVLAGVAAILRWNGFILIISTLILGLIAYRHDLKAAFYNITWGCLVAVLPISLWVLGRNYRIYGTLMGNRDTAAMDLRTNLSSAIVKISHWLLPQKVFEYINPLLICLIFIVLVIIINRVSHWQLFVEHLRQPIHIPWLIFSPIYLVFVLITTIPYDHPLFQDDRYYAPLYLFFMLFLALLFSELIFESLISRTRFSLNQHRIAETMLLVIILIWSLYPTYRIYRYTLASRTEGEIIYNVYNTRKLQESDIIAHLQDKLLKEDKIIYSNIPAAVYFYTRQISNPAPFALPSNQKGVKDLKTNYANWPPSDGSYLIWFLPNPWHRYYEPKELREIANLTKLIVTEEGKIYFVQKLK